MTTHEHDLHDAARELLPVIQAASENLDEVAAAFVKDDQCPIFSSERNQFFIILSTQFDCKVHISEDRSRFSLALNLGLVKFYDEMARMLFSRIRTISESEAKIGAIEAQDTGVPYNHTVSAAKTLMECFWEQRLPQPDQTPGLDLSESNLRLYRVLLPMGVKFALAHEFAHVILDVAPSKKKYQDDGEMLATELLKDFNFPQPDVRERRIKYWGLEFAADRIGFELSIAATKKGKEDFFAWFQWSGIELFLQTCDMLWRYHLATRGRSIEVLGRHPPFHIRLNMLRRAFGIGQREVDIGAAFKKLIDMILADTCGATPSTSVLGDKDVQEQDASTYLLLGKVELTTGNLVEAKRYIELALTIYEKCQNVEGLGNCYGILAAILTRSGSHIEAAHSQMRSVIALSLCRDQIGSAIAGERLEHMVNSRPMHEREIIGPALLTTATEMLEKWAGTVGINVVYKER